MTRAQQIRTQLDQAPRGEGGVIQVGEGDVEVHLRLADWDRLGCLLERVELRHSRGLPLRITPAAVAETVTYLGEALRVIETEEATGRTILRSAPPSRWEGNIAFFELLLDRAQGLSLTRYAYDRQREERQAIPAPLTRHALERLVDDLLALAAGA